MNITVQLETLKTGYQMLNQSDRIFAFTKVPQQIY